LNDWAAAAGGHLRTGLEDNIRIEKTKLAASNAQLVERAVEICASHERPIATVAQARSILGLAQV